MQLFVSLLSLVPASALSSTAIIRWQETLLYASSHLLSPHVSSCLGVIRPPALSRVPDVVIGLSCLAIAATLISFIIGAGKLLPFRYPFIVLAIVVTICGFTHMTAAVLPEDPNVWLAAYLSFLAALLALITACLLPFVLPSVLTVLRGMPQATAAESQSSPLSITPVSTLLAMIQPVSTPQPPPPPQPGAAFAQQDDARLLAATETSLDSFFIFEPLRDSDGKVIDFIFKWLNHNGEELLQKSRAEILSARFSELLSIDAAPNSFDQYRLVLLTGKPYIHEFPLKENDVHGTWMRHHVVKLEDGIAITVTDITERKHSEQYLLHLSQHDALTGLPTRALLDDRILQAIARANRNRSKVAVFLINLDSFQQLGEVYDSNVGDQLIIAVASRLRAAIRSTDSIIRLGADEFVIVMSDIALVIDIRRAAATLVAVLQTPLAVDDRTIQINCSIGASVYPDTAATLQDLLIGADVAMSRAKFQGKNKYVLFTPASQDEPEQLAG